MKNEKIKILNIEIDSVTKKSILDKNLSGVVFPTNVDVVMKLQKDREFFNIYNQADWVLCDSKILWLISKFLGAPIKEVITGSDLFPEYCKKIASKKENNKRVFILGGSTQEILQKSINNLDSIEEAFNYIVGGYCPEFGFENKEEVIEIIIDRINKSGANVLAVGLGAPKQEKLIFKIRNRLPKIELFFAIGATVNFISKDLRRAPIWMQKIGMEWFFRMCSDPSRLIKRYLIEDLPIFLLILKQKLGVYQNPFKR